jgi:hypothetical protein
MFSHRSNIYRALAVNPGSEIVRDEQRIYARDLEVPAGGGVGTARALAHAYGVFATGGRELQLRPETLRALSAPPVPSVHGFYDECVKCAWPFSLGFMRPSVSWPFGSEASFGSPGSGGSLGYADPQTGIGYAYVTSQMGTSLTGDPRDRALTRCACLGNRSSLLLATLMHFVHTASLLVPGPAGVTGTSSWSGRAWAVAVDGRRARGARPAPGGAVANRVSVRA